MTHLLDTGVLIRAALKAQTMPPAVRTTLQRPGTVFALSAYSLWEIGKKVQKGKLMLPQDLGAWFDEVLSNVVVLPLDQRVVVEAMQLPKFPNQGPGDELIVATARVHKLTLLTTDTKLKGYRHAQIEYFKPLPETT